MHRRHAYTLLEILLVLFIIALLIAVLVPSMSRSRQQSHGLQCVTHLRQLGQGWQMYADDNDDLLAPARVPNLGGGSGNSANWYDVGNGLKIRPRWPALVGRYLGDFAFHTPSLTNERQDYASALYRCPTVPERTDERNSAYGYNHQFLGNTFAVGGIPYRFPVNRSEVANVAGTVLFADAMGTAAGLARYDRKDYRRDDDMFATLGNHAWTLDPPRLTEQSLHGTNEPGSPRTGVDPRHLGKANVTFCDGHVESVLPDALGYRMDDDGRVIESAAPEGRRPNNTAFSGTGRDDDPPESPINR